MNIFLCCIEDHKDQICSPGNGNDLSPTTLALRGTLDNTGQIKQLDVGTLETESTVKGQAKG